MPPWLSGELVASPWPPVPLSPFDLPASEALVRPPASAPDIPPEPIVPPVPAAPPGPPVLTPPAPPGPMRLPPVPPTLAPPAPPGPMAPPEPPVVPLVMVLPAWPPLAAHASPALLLRPELLHASPNRPATKRAATAVGILNIWSSVCSPDECEALDALPDILFLHDSGNMVPPFGCMGCTKEAKGA
jgi:hypothetical protein